jgi:hypothetical protein
MPRVADIFLKKRINKIFGSFIVPYNYIVQAEGRSLMYTSVFTLGFLVHLKKIVHPTFRPLKRVYDQIFTFAKIFVDYLV